MFLTGLTAEQTSAMLSRIEEWRQRRIADKSQLVTGMFPQAGLFDDGVTVAEACGVSKKKPNAEQLFSYSILTGARCCIELGTNIGISSSYIAAAMSAAGPDWELHTIDTSPYRIGLAKEMHASLGLLSIRYHAGLFYDVLPSLVSTIGKRIDLAFIDGQHQYQPTLDFFNLIHPYSTSNALFIFDDIEWSEGMANAWAKIQSDKRVLFSTGISGVGFALTRNE